MLSTHVPPLRHGCVLQRAEAGAVVVVVVLGLVWQVTPVYGAGHVQLNPSGRACNSWQLVTMQDAAESYSVDPEEVEVPLHSLKHDSPHTSAPTNSETSRHAKLLEQSTSSRHALNWLSHRFWQLIVLSAQVPPFWHGLGEHPILSWQSMPVNPKAHVHCPLLHCPPFSQQDAPFSQSLETQAALPTRFTC